MKKKKELQRVEIEIKAIAHKGMSLGKTTDGMVVLTKGAVPGDKVEVRLHKKRKGVWNALFSHITEPSMYRVDPLCEHFSLCGGCSWQHLIYAEQLNQKQTIVRDALSRIAKVDVTNMEPIMGADPTFYYRNKMDYTFSTHKWHISKEDPSESSLAIGFHRPESFYKVVDIQKCHLQIDISNQIRNYIADRAVFYNLAYYNIKEHNGLLRNLIIRTNHLSEVMLILVVSATDDTLLRELLDEVLSKFPKIVSCYLAFNQKKNDTLYDVPMQLYYGHKYLLEKLHHVEFYISPKSFFQTNSSQAQNLYALVKEYAALTGGETVYDIYCGVGSIGIYLANMAKKIIGIEEVPDAVIDAKLNASLNQLTNCHFFTGDAKLVATQEFFAEHGAPDLLIVDPPRVGIHETLVETLIHIAAPRIIYVSCNPATQARDVVLLSALYDVIRIRAVDMFPHTNHVESVILLKRK